MKEAGIVHNENYWNPWEELKKPPSKIKACQFPLRSNVSTQSWTKVCRARSSCPLQLLAMPVRHRGVPCEDVPTSWSCGGSPLAPAQVQKTMQPCPCHLLSSCCDLFLKVEHHTESSSAWQSLFIPNNIVKTCSDPYILGSLQVQMLNLSFP